MEYAIFAVILVIVAFVSWAVGVRMGANAAVARIIAETCK
jgi:hypothetical protein